MDPVRELKVRAELLQTGIEKGDAAAVARIRGLPQFAASDEAKLRVVAPELRRKHCLAIVAREIGFKSWEHALSVLDADAQSTITDWGALLYPAIGGALNEWFRTYGEARDAFDVPRGAYQRRYLLPYRTQFFVAETGMIESLSLDPNDGDWESMGFDWVRPRSIDARRRLYAKRIEALRPPKATARAARVGA